MSYYGCSSLLDSLKPAGTLELTATATARFEFTDRATGASTVKEYTIPTPPMRRAWSREVPITPFEINNTVPPVDKFRLVNYCCCWKCQWTTMVRSETGTTQIGNIISDATFDAPWTLTEIAFTGDPPVITTGTSRLTGQILFTFPADSIPRGYCMSETEGDAPGDRVPPTARFILGGITGISNASENAMSWDYTDGEGGAESGGPTSSLQMPTSGSLVFSPIDACGDQPSGWVQIEFSGDASDVDFIDTTTASLRLDFDFS